MYLTFQENVNSPLEFVVVRVATKPSLSLMRFIVLKVIGIPDSVFNFPVIRTKSSRLTVVGNGSRTRTLAEIFGSDVNVKVVSATPIPYCALIVCIPDNSQTGPPVLNEVE